jgi:hypothetical protein
MKQHRSVPHIKTRRARKMPLRVCPLRKGDAVEAFLNADNASKRMLVGGKNF